MFDLIKTVVRPKRMLRLYTDNPIYILHIKEWMWYQQEQR